MTHAQRHRLLVEILAAAIRPVRPLWPVRVRLGLWLLLESVVLWWVATHTGNDFVRKLGHLDYALEVAFFASAATLAAMLALRMAIPGRSAGPREVALSIVLVVAGTVLVLFGASVRMGYPLGQFVEVGLACLVNTCVLAALPWAALRWAVKRGAPMRGAAPGFLTGAAALLFAFALMRIKCPIDEPLHLVTWHLLPALVLTALSARRMAPLSPVSRTDSRPVLRQKQPLGHRDLAQMVRRRPL
jgi:hypothetical protein